MLALEIDDLTVSYDLKPILWDVDINISLGRLVAIVGPNGAGKSTLIKSILNLIKPVSGRIKILSKSYKDVRKRIAYVPQRNSVDWDFPTTVFDVVMMGRYGHIGWIKRPRSKDKEIVYDALLKVDMIDYKDRQISELSGGQQQRVFLARSLVQQADIYLMDEPFQGVDAKTEKAIVDILKNLKENNKTVIVVHHDLETVDKYFDDVILLNKKIIAYGTVKEVFTPEMIKKTYQTKE